MDKKNITVNRNLELDDFLVVVDNIIEGYFDDIGEYKPHFGFFNLLDIFYTFCVVKDDELPQEIGVEELNILMKNDSFIKGFNESLIPMAFEDYPNMPIAAFDFATAYGLAKEAIDARRNSFGNMIDIIKNLCGYIIEKFEPLLSDENIAMLSKLAEEASGGKIDSDSIVKAFTKYMYENDESDIVEAE